MPYKDPQKRREYHAVKSREWDAANPDRRLAIGRKADQKRSGSPKRMRQSATAHNRAFHRARLYVLKMYGNCCAYCGTDLYEVLCIDHVNDNGREHRASGVGCIYRFLATQPYQPDEYQILCYNCNQVKDSYGIKPGGNEYRSREEWEAYSKPRKAIKGFSSQASGDL